MTNKAHYPGMGIENLVNSGELQNGQSRAKVAKATRCNDQFYGTYTQVSGSARHPERMMIWSALYGNIQLGINPGVGLTNQLEHKGYGALANGYFRHHRTKDAEAITIQGQQAVRYLAKRISHFISTLVDETVSPDEIYVYGDTDSAYFTIDAIVEKYKDRIPPEKLVDFLDKFIETKIQPEINATFVDLADYMNCFQNKMGAKREAIASSGVFCVHPETSISVNGELVAIETLFNETDGDSDVRMVRDKSVMSYNERTQRIERDDIQLVVRKWYAGDMYTITTPNQNVIRITADHLVLVKRGVDLVWVAAKELLESDTVLEV